MTTIVDIINEIAGGMVYDKANEALEELTAAVLDTGKKGTLTIKLEVSQNGETTVSITPEVNYKLPQHKLGQTIFFANGGVLTREDPRQKKLPLREVSKNDNVRELT